MQRIVFRVTETTFGSPEPYIPDGTYVILVQDGRAQVGRYEAPNPPDEPSPAFAHPVNVNDLESAALDAVRSAFPRFERIKTSQVYTCPTELAARAIWDSTGKSA